MTKNGEIALVISFCIHLRENWQPWQLEEYTFAVRFERLLDINIRTLHDIAPSRRALGIGH